MNSEDKIKILSDKPARDFIREHKGKSTADLAFKFKDKSPAPLTLLLEQIESGKKAEEKLPEWNLEGIIFPPRVNLEQSSSSQTADFKARVYGKDKKHVVDLSAGFGVDAYYFSKVAEKVTMVEPDTWLCALAAHNFKIMGIDNIEVVNSTAEDFNIPITADLIYIDPSRRSNTGKKVIRLQDYSPDPFEIKKKINIPFLLKTSPMVDVEDTYRELGNIREVRIISRKDQVRELLFYREPLFTGETLICANEITQDFQFSFFKTDEQKEEINTCLPETGGYLYSPYSVLMKSGCFKLLAKETDTCMAHPHTHIYFSKEQKPFPGSTFLITEILPAGLKEVKKQISGSDWVPISKNFPVKSEDLRKKLKLSSSDVNFIWFVKTMTGYAAIKSTKIG